MSFGNIVGNMVSKGMSSRSHDRLRTGAENAQGSGGIEQMVGSLMRGSRQSGTGGSDLTQMAAISSARSRPAA